MPWNPITEPQDWVDFAGRSTPGIATVVGASSPRRWDERESYGWSGAFVVYHGQNLSHFSVKLKLYTPDDWNDWYVFKPLVARVPLGKRQRPLDIGHPLTQQLGIFAVVVEDVTQAEQVEDGVWEIEIKLIEYRSPRLALAAAKGSEAEAADPEDAIQEERNAQKQGLLDELQSIDDGNNFFGH
jgi:hypothetical protein